MYKYSCLYTSAIYIEIYMNFIKYSVCLNSQ